MLVAGAWLAFFAAFANAQGTTTRVSVAPGGVQGDGHSYHPSFSPDGRFVAFESEATNLVPGDTNGANDIFLVDLHTGAIKRVSVDSNGVQGNQDSSWPSVSSDGRYVAFASYASNFTPIDFNVALDVFVRDTVANTTTLVSASISGIGTGNAGSWAPRITPDGRFVAFFSSASDIRTGAPDTNGFIDVYLFDAQTGVNTLVSVGSQGQQGDWDSGDNWAITGSVPAVSADGRYVAFESYATNFLANDVNYHAEDVFLRDTLLGTTTLVSASASGAQALNYSRAPAISADGRYVAFQSPASNLVPGDTNGGGDVFVKDTLTGAIERVDVGPGGSQGSGGSHTGGGGFSPVPITGTAISADGRFVGFGSKFTNLVAPDANDFFDVFVHDRLLAKTTLVSVSSMNVQGDDMSIDMAISGDGSLVAFDSFATNLVAGDTNGVQDVFLRKVLVPYSSFCFGDESTLATPCPCANTGEIGHGCENSKTTGGGLCFAEGTASVASDTIAIHAFGLPHSSVAIFLQGTLQQNGGLGTVLGDGLRCLAGTQIRLGHHATSNSGSASFGFGVAGDPSVSTRGMIPSAGGVRYYQVHYRDGAAFCTSDSFNWTNAIRIAWTP
jgi:Tol biopolymer transport system component